MPYSTDRMTIEFQCAGSLDIETLVTIRIAAMKESLENIGRFDPQRSRERLVENFRPALKGSKANLFYTRNGFIQYGEEPFDNLYRWSSPI